jgi:hypothetical protein
MVSRSTDLGLPPPAEVAEAEVGSSLKDIDEAAEDDMYPLSAKLPVRELSVNSLLMLADSPRPPNGCKESVGRGRPEGAGFDEFIRSGGGVGLARGARSG